MTTKNKGVISLLFLVSTQVFCEQQSLRSWSNDDYQLNYPKSWKVFRSETEIDCSLLYARNANSSIRPKNYDLKICTHYDTFEKALENSAFHYEHGNWVASGSMDQQTARKTLVSNGDYLIETIIPPTCGITDLNLVFHAAGGQCYSAILGNKKISVLVESDGINKNFLLMSRITRSIILKRR